MAEEIRLVWEEVKQYGLDKAAVGVLEIVDVSSKEHPSDYV